MAGDGVDDALAPPRQILGFIIGTGADVAMEAGGITLFTATFVASFSRVVSVSPQ